MQPGGAGASGACTLCRRRGGAVRLSPHPRCAGRDTFPVTAPSLLTAEEGVSTLCDGGGAGDRSSAGGGHSRRAYAGGKSGPPPTGRSCSRPSAEGACAGEPTGARATWAVPFSWGCGCWEATSSTRRHLRREGERSPAVGDGAEPDRLTGGGRLPPVEIVSPEEVFDGDVFLFCASRFVPDTSVTSGDVRMAQYQVNRELAVRYARMARQRRYGGMFCVVSDPVDPLCRAVLEESNRGRDGPVGRRRVVFPSGAGASDWGSCRPEPCTMPGRSHGLPPF